ncbi:hypothetical protein D9M68_756910 [compost metagenome]
MELGHVVAQEGLGTLIGHLPIVRDQAGLELDIGFGRVHLRRIAEAEHAAQVLLGHSRADGADRGADDSRWLAPEGVLPIGAAGPVNGVLQPARDRAVVLRGDEQHRIDIGNRCLEGPGDGGKVGVIVIAIERQIAERNLGHDQFLWCEPHQCQGKFAVDRAGGEAADKISDLVGVHERPPGKAGTRRADGKPVQGGRLAVSE